MKTLRLVLLLIAVFAVSACDSGGNAGDIDGLIRDARVAMMQNDNDRAAELFNRVLEIDPDNVSALVALADIHMSAGDLAQVAAAFERLDQLELSGREESTVADVRRRYWESRYESARGEGPENPADAELYEEALIGLFNIDPNPTRERELATRLIYNARRALGASDPTVSLAENTAIVREATPEQLAAALEAYRRITERDPRILRVIEYPEAVQREADVIVPVLEFTVFDRELRAGFDAHVKPALLAEERFLADGEVIVISRTEPSENELPEEGPERDALRDWLVRNLTVSELTDLYFRARQQEVPEMNLPSGLFGTTPEERAAFFDGVTVPTFEVARDNTVTLTVHVPYRMLPVFGYRLNQYLEYLAERGEGSGAGTGATAAGTGAGTGEESGEAPAGDEPEGEADDGSDEESDEEGEE